MARAKSEVKQIQILNKQLKRQCAAAGGGGRNEPIMGIMKQEERKLKVAAKEKRKAARRADRGTKGRGRERSEAKRQTCNSALRSLPT